jgi:hypothetical protein
MAKPLHHNDGYFESVCKVTTLCIPLVNLLEHHHHHHHHHHYHHHHQCWAVTFNKRGWKPNFIAYTFRARRTGLSQFFKTKHHKIILLILCNILFSSFQSLTTKSRGNSIKCCKWKGIIHIKQATGRTHETSECLSLYGETSRKRKSSNIQFINPCQCIFFVIGLILQRLCQM